MGATPNHLAGHPPGLLARPAMAMATATENTSAPPRKYSGDGPSLRANNGTSVASPTMASQVPHRIAQRRAGSREDDRDHRAEEGLEDLAVCAHVGTLDTARA